VEALQAKFRPIFDDPKETARTPNAIQYKVLADAISLFLALCPLRRPGFVFVNERLYGGEGLFVLGFQAGAVALGWPG
jgi:hypothetical protein